MSLLMCAAVLLPIFVNCSGRVQIRPHPRAAGQACIPFPIRQALEEGWQPRHHSQVPGGEATRIMWPKSSEKVLTDSRRPLPASATRTEAGGQGGLLQTRPLRNLLGPHPRRWQSDVHATGAECHPALNQPCPGGQERLPGGSGPQAKMRRRGSSPPEPEQST